MADKVNYSPKITKSKEDKLSVGYSPIIPSNATPSPTPNYGEGSETSTSSKTVDLRREAFNRKQFDDTINTEFTELGQSNVEQDLSFFDPSLATVGDFFTIYQTLFYQIPKEGETNSHTFLIKESTEYTQYVAQAAEIEELQREIDELREQNVTLVKDMTNTLNSLSGLGEQITDQLNG
jgi:hypothetical protein|tara:strand:- start:147 stop:683 length:537 start_codon:yes stop_codon:yes gene_type:complete